MTMDKDSANGNVQSTIFNDICAIEFHHPQGNSLPPHLLVQLADAIKAAGQTEEVRVILLRAGGTGAFCAGASFDELLKIDNEQAGAEFFSGFANVINAMRKCPKFIIARVHGKCVGGGVGLAAAADYVIALEDAAIKLSELSIGIGPLVIAAAVERKMGVAAFSQMTIDSTSWHSAAWAQAKGLYAELHARPGNMDAAIARLANTLAQTSPEAMAEIKKVFWHHTSDWEALMHERAAICGKLVLSPHTKACLQQFKLKKANKG